ncbi:ORMDL-domain-containing protein [Piromyces finnis]|uniref:ORMDL-domain-containing protein n=1 Tax=Piromyces finnis TaxID=1754191 RepID=A0A1Y1VIK3_9FUNG|nr:ORMDL-domain-containing protein [Piromyces finnis]|eukprot:ORX57223.1 ORMDL-domain-containing protein [Piromyces finnis]
MTKETYQLKGKCYGTDANPNSGWINHKGMWITNIIIIVILKTAFTIIPGISPEISWTLTNVVYNLGSLFFFHWVMGTPFELNQGEEFGGLTLWEQMDDRSEFTPTKKYLTAVPVVLFLISSFQTKYDLTQFIINFASLVIILIARLPFMHEVRIFGINKRYSDEE